jgi:hypothetical protein
MVNGCVRQLLVARRDVIAPEFISCGIVIRAINRKLCLKMEIAMAQRKRGHKYKRRLKPSPLNPAQFSSVGERQ